MVEILREVLGSKESSNAVLDQLRSQYKLVLIDEFQDTDMSQWQIFSQVFTPAAKDSDRVLIMVGDPKQAIYRFRGADVSAYVNAVNAPGITRHDMTVNWRSDADLITALNTLFEGADFGRQQIPYIPVQPREKAPDRALSLSGKKPKPLELRYITKADANGADADGVRAAIAVDLANYVHSLIGNAEIVAGDGTRRKVRAKDIAILLRANADSRYFRNELRALGIPAVESRVGGVNESDAFDQVQVFMNVLNAVSDARRVRSLVFTWFSDLELKDLVDGGKIEALQLQCAKWADDLARKGVSYMYEQVRAESALMRQIAGSEAPTRHLTDIEHVFELLSAATGGRPVAPAVALHHLDQIRDADKESETLLRRTETDADAVQITSMHASKGLEYPIVLLPVPKGISTETPYVYTVEGVRYVDGANKIDWDRAPHGDRDARKDRAKAEDLDDLRRLIYVALTRARHQLTVWWASTQGAHKGALGSVLFKESSDLKDTQFTDDVVEAALDAWKKAGKRNIGVTKLNFDAELVEVTNTAKVEPLNAAALNISAVQPNDYEWARWSFSSINKDQHSAREESPKGGTDESHDDEQGTPAPVGALGGFVGSADFGTYLHEVMEHVDFAAADLNVEVARVVEAQRVPEFIGDAQADFVQGIVEAIRTPLAGLGGKPLSAISRADRLAELRFDMSLGENSRTKLAELAALAAAERGSPFADYFRTQANDWGGRHATGFLTGSIDALFRLDVDGQQKFVVVDYKSNNLTRFNAAHPYGYESMRAAMMASGYPLQALIYSVATHRFLRSRLNGYDPSLHLGGCGYLFMRGMIGEYTPAVDGVADGVFVWRPSTELVIGADRVLGGGDA
jgi:exodeoxyribonuclease V beta subunit